jgi:hypothetical protein
VARSGNRLRRSALAAGAALAPLAAAAIAAAAPAVGHADYLGATSQGQAIAIETASTGRAIGALRTGIVYDGLCGTRPDSPPYQLLSYSEVALRANGSFSFTVTAIAEGPGPQRLTVALAGTFAGRAVHGTLTAIGRGARCAGAGHANPYRATFSARVAG